MATRLRALRIGTAAIAGSIALAAAASPAAAEILPRPEQIASQREAPALNRLIALVTGPEADRSDPLPELDAMLREAPGPTPLRGYIQYLRAFQLAHANRGGEAGAAIDESIRLLPSFTGPLMLATSIEAFNDRPAEAADALLRAIALAPEDARGFPDFELSNLVVRLGERHDERRLNLLARRLFEIGARMSDLVLRSTLARGLIRARVQAGDIAGASAVLPNLALPEHARELLLMNEYRALWPNVEAWTGPRQSRQWEAYLRETGARWRASRDPELASPYVRALLRAGHFETIVREMLPALMGPLDRLEDYDQVWSFSPVATALARLGRWDEADALFSRALLIWPLGADANALNFVANRARLRLYRGDSAGALSAIDAALADVPRWGGAVSPGPLAAMHFIRACALHRLGRDGEALSSVAAVAQAGPLATIVDLYLCLDRPDSARTALIDALGRDGTRADAVEFVQPDGSPPMPSEFGRELAARRDRLRRDPALREAALRHGRILPYAAEAGAPAEAAAP